MPRQSSLKPRKRPTQARSRRPSRAIALHEHEPDLQRVLFEEAPLPSVVRREIRKRENDLMAEVSALLESHPEVAMKRPQVTAYLVVQSVDALVHNFTLHPPDDIDAETPTAEIVAMLARHLRQG